MVRNKVIVLWAAVFVLAASTSASAFTLGNLVVMRGGDANSPQATFGSGQVPAYIDEYSISIVGTTATASFVGSNAVSTATLTLPGITANSHEGRLELSGNGQYLNFAGYQQAVSSTTPRVTNNSGTGSYYQVGQVKFDGTFSNSSLDTTIAQPQFMRGAYSNDGTQAWVASKSPTGGLEYISNFGTGSATTVQLQGTTDWRDIKVNDGQLYGGTGSSSVGTHGFYAISSIASPPRTPTAPITSTNTNVLLSDNNDNSVSGFSLVTLLGGNPIDGNAGTANVVYAVGAPSGNNYIGKLVSNGTPLTTNDLTFAGGSRLALTAGNYGGGEPEGILARIDPNNSTWVDLFLQDSTGVYFAIDQSGTSTGSISTLSFTKIIGTAGLPLETGGALYGVSLAPVPEPSSIVLAIAGGMLSLAAARRIRRQAKK